MTTMSDCVAAWVGNSLAGESPITDPLPCAMLLDGLIAAAERHQVLQRLAATGAEIEHARTGRE